MAECAALVIKKDGVIGLFGRGLSTRIVTNGLQGIMFNVMWRMGIVLLASYHMHSSHCSHHTTCILPFS